MTGSEWIQYIVENKLYDKEMVLQEKEVKIQKKEPEQLSDICKVTYEYGRMVLLVDKEFILASRKFGLKDTIEKYEYDGATFYFYKNKDQHHSYSYSWGRGAWTCVSAEASKCMNKVKEEMYLQVKREKIMVPEDLIYDLKC